jgi:predicted dehydrogenase
MVRSLRAGIAGTGFIGGVHARSIRQAGARLVGVAASTPARSAAAASELGAEQPFGSAEELAESPDIDVLHICTPNNLHVPLAERALAAGKHVICEKPLALTLEEAHSIAEAASSAGSSQAAVPFVYRYYPTVREARERVHNGTAGRIQLAHGSYLQDWLLSPDDDNWRVDAATGGASRAFADIGSHWCDLVEFVTGHRITRLNAQMATAHPERRRAAARAFETITDGATGETRQVETEDAAVVQFQTDRGALGSVVISQVSPGRKNRLWFELDGTEEALVFDQEEPETLWCGRREAATVIKRDPGTLSPAAARLATLPGGHPQGYGDCFDAFVGDVYEAIRTGVPAEGMPGFNDGLRAAQITDAVLRSHADGNWADVEAPVSMGAAS